MSRTETLATTCTRWTHLLVRNGRRSDRTHSPWVIVRSLGPALFGPVLVIANCAQQPVAADRATGPDLGLVWTNPTANPDEHETRQALRLTYRLFNQGDTDAYAVIVESRTALGALRPARRLEPGPRAGDVVDLAEQLSLVPGMRELCVEVKLQTLAAGAPQDPNPTNDRICRTLRPSARSS